MLQRQEDDVFPQVRLFYRQSFCFFLRGKIRSPGDVEERARRLGRDCRGDAEAGKCELSVLVVVFSVTLRRARALSISFERQFRARFYSSLSWIALDFWISLLSLREVEKERKKSSFSRMRMQYFSSFPSLSLSKN